jgi:hypothetical protein
MMLDQTNVTGTTDILLGCGWMRMEASAFASSSS